MSKDFTPKALFIYNEWCKKECNRDLSDSVVFSSIDGQDYMLNGNAELRTKYPNLYFTFGNTLEALCRNDHYDKDVLNGILSHIESVVTELVDYTLHPDTVEHPALAPEDKYIESWFNGTLDPLFYYNRVNDEMFHARITGKYLNTLHPETVRDSEEER